MPTTNIPDSDEILRHVKARLLEKDPDNLQLIGFLPQAFELKTGEDHLSAAWMQFFAGARPAQIAAVIGDMGGSFEIKKNDRFALGVVGAIKSVCARYNVRPRIVHDGEGYPSHAAVRQFGGAPPEALALLAREAWAEMITPTAATIAASKAARRLRP